MDFADSGDLLQKIRANVSSNTQMEEDEIWSYSLQMLRGIAALHHKKILHRDLKSANVFVYNEGTMKIGDMNVSKIMQQALTFTQTGTPYYASPEVWRDKPYDFKSDIWSFGIIVYEMTMGKVPFKAEDIDGLYKKICRGKYDDID